MFLWNPETKQVLGAQSFVRYSKFKCFQQPEPFCQKNDIYRVNMNGIHFYVKPVFTLLIINKFHNCIFIDGTSFALVAIKCTNLTTLKYSFSRYWYLWDRSRHLLDKEIKVNFTLYLIEWKEHVAWRNRSFWFSRWIIISYYTMVAIWGQHISTDLIMCDV